LRKSFFIIRITGLTTTDREKKKKKKKKVKTITGLDLSMSDLQQ